MKQKDHSIRRLCILWAGFLLCIGVSPSFFACSFGDTARIAGDKAQGRSISSDSSKQDAWAPDLLKPKEADIYKVKGSYLYYLHPQKGFQIFDLQNPAKPQILAHLPVYGVPIEMFLEGNTAYLFVHQPPHIRVSDRNIPQDKAPDTQLFIIDIETPEQPSILRKLTLEGYVRQGLSRRLGPNLYVVSEKANKDGATIQVHRFDVSEPKNTKLLQSYTLPSLEQKRLLDSSNAQQDAGVASPIHEGDPEMLPKAQETRPLRFLGTAITMTSRYLIIAENWEVQTTYETLEQQYIRDRGSFGCFANSGEVRQVGYFANTVEIKHNQAVISVLDLQREDKDLRVLSRFPVDGAITDQFKQSVVTKPGTQTPLYLGILRRQQLHSNEDKIWTEGKNIATSIDLADPQAPKSLHEIPFGKPKEAVRASLFDPDRKVFYAITATGDVKQKNVGAKETQNEIDRAKRAREVVRSPFPLLDPLYAIGYENPKKLTILSEVDELNGDINLFRPLEGGKFLIAVGRDTSDSCTGFDKGTQALRTSVNLIDARNLKKLRLIQRKCVQVGNSKLITSQIEFHRDQAHKMIGLHLEKGLSMISVPVLFQEKRTDKPSLFKTAVGLMRWDLKRYDDTKDETQQNVLESLGSWIHPQGEVKRTFFLQLPQQGELKRTLVNLSDDVLALVDMDDPKQPQALGQLAINERIEGVTRVGKDIWIEYVRYPSSSTPQELPDDRWFLRIRRLGEKGPKHILREIELPRGTQSILRWKKPSRGLSNSTKGQPFSNELRHLRLEQARESEASRTSQASQSHRIASRLRGIPRNR